AGAEAGGRVGIPERDRRYLDAEPQEAGIGIAQPRDLLLAVRSAVVAKEDEQDGSLRPQLREAQGPTFAVEQLDVGRAHQGFAARSANSAGIRGSWRRGAAAPRNSSRRRTTRPVAATAFTIPPSCHRPAK